MNCCCDFCCIECQESEVNTENPNVCRSERVDMNNVVVIYSIAPYLKSLESGRFSVDLA